MKYRRNEIKLLNLANKILKRSRLLLHFLPIASTMPRRKSTWGILKSKRAVEAASNARRERRALGVIASSQYVCVNGEITTGEIKTRWRVRYREYGSGNQRREIVV